MQLNLTILSTVVNGRVLRSGEDKGTTKYSVDIYAHGGDNVPSKFAVSGFATEADAQAFASKYPHNTSVSVKYVPREAVWLDTADIVAAKK